MSEPIATTKNRAQEPIVAPHLVRICVNQPIDGVNDSVMKVILPRIMEALYNPKRQSFTVDFNLTGDLNENMFCDFCYVTFTRKITIQFNKP